MNRLKALIRSVFAFSRVETNGFLILLPLMALIIFSEPAYRYWFVRQPQDFSKDSDRLDSLVATWKWEEKEDEEKIENRTKEFSLFSFDPNLASADDFIKMGFSSSLANRIVNYRSKGGKFATKSDLLKIYGMDTVQYQKVYSYIDLPEEKLVKNTSNANVTENRAVTKAKLDLNVADTAQLDKVYGIGKKLSERIVKYRNRLGGFVSMDQLKEVYGLDSLVVKNISEKFTVEENYLPVQLNINSATERELGSHPYLSFKLAKAIAAYRFQHGQFTSLDDLTKVQLLNENDFKRIKPYLTVE
jgi:competence protein ComEA